VPNISTRINTALMLEALRMALAEQRPDPSVAHYSNQGAQYASSEYVDELKRYGFKISMARVDNPYKMPGWRAFSRR